MIMINRRRVIGNKKGLLPSGYKQLEYIENTSNAYIDTGIVPESNGKVETEIFVDSYISNQNRCVWCARGNNTSDGTFSCFVMHRDAPWGVNVPCVRMDRPPGNIYFSFQYAAKIKIDYDGKRAIGSITINGTKIQEALQSGGYTVPNVMRLMVSYTNNSSFGNQFVGKMYYFKYIDGNENVVLNFIPCINSNNVVGMYDTVGKQFYLSPNGAAFIAGPEV